MSRKILISLSAIGVAAAIVIGATTAYFSDTEISSGNTFTAGSIDLKVDNHCYYNGAECELANDGKYHWNGNVNENECFCTWELTDLDGKLFFDFEDLKPGDHGEDTVSLHVTNDAWVCLTLTPTAAWENGMTEPEKKIDSTWGQWGGELDDYLEFVFWADMCDNGDVKPGDNKYTPDCDVLLTPTPISVASDETTGSIKLPIADSQSSIFTYLGEPVPLSATTTYYVGKAWCFGKLDMDELKNNGIIKCDGSGDASNHYYNDAQTDQLIGDVEFYVVQARNNSNFTCLPSGN